MKRSKLFVVVSLCLTILVCIFFSVYKAFSEEKLMNVNDNIPIQEDRGDEEVNEPDTTPSVRNIYFVFMYFTILSYINDL